jgi:predicted site-specific integrase-resolvase
VVYAQEQDKSKDKQEVAEDFRNNVHMSCMKLYKKDL